MEEKLIQKLRIPPGQRLLILNAPSDFLDSMVGDLRSGGTADTVASGKYPYVHLFAKNSEDLERLRPIALQAIEYDGIFWLSYPKKSSGAGSDLARDLLWEAVPGMRPVTQISIDDTWSALRFRPGEMVGK